MNDKLDSTASTIGWRCSTSIETDFIKSKRGDAPQAHQDVYKKAVNLMTSKQMAAFQIQDEKPEMLSAYGANNFGRGLVDGPAARRIGVPFVEVRWTAGICTSASSTG